METQIQIKQITAIDPIAAALKLAMPSWPLQNTVAVNPFWNRRDETFSGVMEELAPVIHAKPYMPLPYYLGKYRAGAITDRALDLALETAKGRLASVPTIDELVRSSATDPDLTQPVLTFAEAYDVAAGTRWSSALVDEASKFAAAYFDDAQAIVRFPWRDRPFWQAWLAAQELDRSIEALGAAGFRDVVRKSAGQTNARDFIATALGELGIVSETAQMRYLSRLLMRGLGWATQFKYCEWQRSLGYEETPTVEAVDYLAVLVAYDYGLASCLKAPTLLQTWRESLQANTMGAAPSVHPFALHQIWQSAFELTHQASVAARLAAPTLMSTRPQVQVVMCIDVRSEVMRRALESVAPTISTLGFAGFFGLGLDYLPADEGRVSHRLPVLLPPMLRVEEEVSATERRRRAGSAYRRTFFRDLRKLPLASFFYVELLGIYAAGKLLRRSIESFFAHRSSNELPRRFRCRPQLGNTDVSAKVERAATVLRHMGLTRNFARLVVISGHGSTSANNAFASALDCGACGGHAGDINARVLVGLLNNPEVRRGLANMDITIPHDTWFLAAIHETVTDRIHLLDQANTPASHAGDVERLVEQIATASAKARCERQTLRSVYLDSSPERRVRSWSEIRPEWGLAGNASFIVGPRAWSTSINLEGRAFLHDYDAARDDGYATLELILTAPMVVTNWINLQYYASTVMPRVYGAGDKTLHNLVNECGVLEGNSGDLRIGLPMQSVHDGNSFVHEPLRLSVFVAAPRDAIEAVIAKHSVVRELVDNGWLFLLHLDVTTGCAARRLPGGLYTTLPALE